MSRIETRIAKAGMRAAVGAVMLGAVAAPLAAEDGSYLKIPDGDGYVAVMTHPFKDMPERKPTRAEQKMPQVSGVIWQTYARPRDDSAHGSQMVARPADTAHGSRVAEATRPADTAHGSRLTGIRAHKPLRLIASVRWRGCEQGATYSHVLLGDGKGKEYRLEGVTVARCGGEQVALNYEEIKF